MARSALFLAALSLTACDASVVDSGPAGPPGARGPAGVAGSAGATGPAGAPGVCPPWRPTTYVIDGHADIGPDSDPQGVVLQVYCDEGDIVIGGGCQWGDWRDDHVAEVVPYLTGPIGQSGGPDSFNGWQCHGIGTGETTTMHVVATCLEMPDDG